MAAVVFGTLVAIAQGLSVVGGSGNPVDMLSEHAYNGNLEGVRVALGNVINVNGLDSGGYSPLISAAYGGHKAIAEELLNSGAGLEVIDNAEHGATALISAAYRNHSNIVETLLNRGANVNAKTWDGSTALMAAAFVEAPEVARMLLQRGADPFVRGSWANLNALTIAQVLNNHMTAEVIQRFIESQKNPPRYIRPQYNRPPNYPQQYNQPPYNQGPYNQPQYAQPQF